MHTVVEMPGYLKDAKKAGLSDEERQEISNFIARHPETGEVIPGTGGARKVRFAVKGKGKSGGVRVITFYSGIEIPVFLLNVFAKNEKTDLSGAERNEMRTVLGELVEIYKGRK